MNTLGLVERLAVDGAFREMLKLNSGSSSSFSFSFSASFFSRAAVADGAAAVVCFLSTVSPKPANPPSAAAGAAAVADDSPGDVGGFLRITTLRAAFAAAQSTLDLTCVIHGRTGSAF